MEQIAASLIGLPSVISSVQYTYSDPNADMAYQTHLRRQRTLEDREPEEEEEEEEDTDDEEEDAADVRIHRGRRTE